MSYYITKNNGNKVLAEAHNTIDSNENSNQAITIIEENFGEMIYCTNNTSITVTIKSTLKTIKGQTFTIVQWGDGQVTAIGDGIVIESVSTTVKTLEKGAAIQFLYLGENVWHCFGALENN